MMKRKPLGLRGACRMVLAFSAAGMAGFSAARAATVEVNPSDPNAINVINQYAAIDGSDIYLTDGNRNTVDPPLVLRAISAGQYEAIRISGNNVKLRGESVANTCITRDEISIGREIIFVTGRGSEISDVLLTDAALGIAYQGDNYGESTNFLKRVKIQNMSLNGVQWKNYHRQNTVDPALLFSDCVFNNIYGSTANYISAGIPTLDSSPYPAFFNCTFNRDVVGEQAVNLPIHNVTKEMLGTFDSCTFSGFKRAFNEQVYLSNSPSNNGKRSSGTSWVCVHRADYGCDSWVLEDVAFSDPQYLGKDGNFVAEPDYIGETLVPANPLFYGSRFVNGRAFADLTRPEEPQRGDFDNDMDVDLADFAEFQRCFNGPNRAPASNCGRVDMDSDGDVDLVDFGRFQECFNGPNTTPRC